MWLLESGSKYVEYVIKIKSATGALGKWILCMLEVCGLRIGYGIICGLYFLKTRLVTTLVRMMLAGQSTIGSFDFVGCGARAHTQSLIGILHKEKWSAQ
jgi:hypothetical protein